MGAWESNGYGKVVDPFWDNKEKSSGGGGLPVVSHPGEMLVSKFSADYQSIETEWRDIKDAIGGNAVPVGTSADVGKVLGKTGAGTSDIGWVSPGGSEVVLFDGDVEVESGHTGYFVREIPLADRIELCQGVHSKYSTLTIEASYITSRPQDEKTETVNISRSFDLEKLLIGDAQTYNDPQYDTDDTAHVMLRNDDLVERFGGERYLQTTIQINQNGTDPANGIYTGKFFRVTFSYYTFNNGSSEYLSLPKEQKVRARVTVK